MGQNMNKTKPELLAPAGNMEKLKIAVHYGADAVYMGGKAFGLRNLADNFTTEEMAEALSYCHARSVKAYLTINSYPHNASLPTLESYLEEISNLPFDAYIVADPGVIELVKNISPERELHLSTQANTVNWRSVSFWQKQGIKRFNLARETTLKAMQETVDRTAAEIEVFVHGALCISYSGRCLLSSAMSGRNANLGECSHPCRWNYHLMEETRPGEYFPVMEDQNGTFIFNSRDLCLLEYLPEIVNAGAASLKIEGRMKGANYVASVLRVYRKALDAYLENPSTYQCQPEWIDELSKLSHRGYTTGFLFGEPRNVGQEYHAAYIRTHEFVGIVENTDTDGHTLIEVRNRIRQGDRLEFIGPDMRSDFITIDNMQLVDAKGGLSPVAAANPNQRIRLQLPFKVSPFDLLRREKGAP